MFELLGMFSKALGMFYSENDSAVSTTIFEIVSESNDPLLSESSEFIITE
jgi:hypothetical protein